MAKNHTHVSRFHFIWQTCATVPEDMICSLRCRVCLFALCTTVFLPSRKSLGSHSSFGDVVWYVFLCFHVFQRCRLDVSVLARNLAVFKMLVALDVQTISSSLRSECVFFAFHFLIPNSVLPSRTTTESTSVLVTTSAWVFFFIFYLTTLSLSPLQSFWSVWSYLAHISSVFHLKEALPSVNFWEAISVLASAVVTVAIFSWDFQRVGYFDFFFAKDSFFSPSMLP